MKVGCGTVRWHRDADEDDEAKRRSCGTRRQRCRVAWRCGMQAAMSIRLGVWCRVGVMIMMPTICVPRRPLAGWGAGAPQQLATLLDVQTLLL
jgi:hypothetical protein